MPVFGVDGCRAGWIAAAAERAADMPSFHLFRTFGELVDAVRGAGSLALVDVPIGLSDGRRACDGAARALLGGRRACCVFTPPSRRVLAAAGRPAAEIRRLNMAATGGRSLSSQAIGILPKIAEVDRLITPELQRSIRECHPECVFAALSGKGAGLPHRKKSPAGRRERLALLPRAFARAAEAPRPFPAGAVALDDYVDALAALVAALRLRGGAGGRLPADGEERDPTGLAMEILF